MTSCCLCANVVNNISLNFNLCNFQTEGYARIHLYVQYCIRMEITVLYFMTLFPMYPSVLLCNNESQHVCITVRCRIARQALLEDRDSSKTNKQTHIHTKTFIKKTYIQAQAFRACLPFMSRIMVSVQVLSKQTLKLVFGGFLINLQH